MEEITIILMLLSIGLFLIRYVIRKTGVQYLTVVTSVCGLVATLKDATIPSDDLLFYLFPTLFVMMVTICSVAFDKKG